MTSLDIIKRAIITEKTLNLAKTGCFTFAVAPLARKEHIKAAIENIFKVEVQRIKTLKIKGKTKRSSRSRRVVRQLDGKKAIVFLAPGQKIDLFTIEEEKSAKKTKK